MVLFVLSPLTSRICIFALVCIFLSNTGKDRGKISRCRLRALSHRHMAQPTQWKRPFLVWSEAVRDLRLPTQREAIDLRHLGSMWVLDAEKKGKVSEKNVEDFSRRCSERLHDFPPSEFAVRHMVLRPNPYLLTLYATTGYHPGFICA
jgi:hypothetical protein